MDVSGDHSSETDDEVEIVLLTGPAGVGKSTLSWEISARLAEAGIAHAAIETDELDRVFPRPSREQLEQLAPGTMDISALNLTAMWSIYRKLGQRRLILSGVMLHPAFDRRWITSAISNARIITIRLMATGESIAGRLARRETEGGLEAQLERSLRQLNQMAREAGGDMVRIHTDGRSVAEIAEEVLANLDWRQ